MLKSERISPIPTTDFTFMPVYQSKPVISTQLGIHDKLQDTVRKHVENAYLKPIQSHNQEAFDRFTETLAALKPERLILDSCCGTALSTQALAAKNPDALVVGIDQSYKRLNKDYDQDGNRVQLNKLLLRCNCEDFWRLCTERGIRFAEHHILYPNPWPKGEHLKRRWHGHPVFPVLPSLADATYLRSNWKLYLEEFAAAWRMLPGQAQARCELAGLTDEPPLTLFEAKYGGSGQSLYALSIA